MTVSACNAATVSSARVQLARESGVDPRSHMCVRLYTTSPETTRLRPGTWTTLECPVSVVPTGITVAAESPTGTVVPASGVGATGMMGSWPGKNPPQTCMYPGEICSSIAGMDSARATGLAAGNAARISGSPRKWSAWGCVMYTYPGSRPRDFTQAASFRPSCSVTRQSTSRAPSSSLIRVEVDGGQVAGPTASSKPGTALGIGLGSTMKTSNSRLIAFSGSAVSGAQSGFRYPSVDAFDPG